MSVNVVTLSYPDLALIEVVGTLIGVVTAEDPALAEKLRVALQPLQNRYDAGQSEPGRDDAGLAVMAELRRLAPATIPGGND